MKYKTNTILITLIFIAIGLLITFNLAYLFLKPNEYSIISPNHVRGMAVVYDGKEYPLNFEQQNEIIALLNRSEKMGLEGFLTVNQDELPYTSLIIYPFEERKITISPIGTEKGQLIMRAPQLNPNGLLRETGPGKLHPILITTYD